MNILIGIAAFLSLLVLPVYSDATASTQSHHVAQPQRGTIMTLHVTVHMGGPVLCLQLFLALPDASSLISVVVPEYGLFNFRWRRWADGVFGFPSGNIYDYAPLQKEVVRIKRDQLNMWG